MGCSIYDVLPEIGKTTLLCPPPWKPDQNKQQGFKFRFSCFELLVQVVSKKNIDAGGMNMDNKQEWLSVFGKGISEKIKEVILE